jgi:hypothetical protein
LNTVATLPLPERADLDSAAGWKHLEMPPEVQLAVAVLPPVAEGGTERNVIWSPLLQVVERLDHPPEELDPPVWYTNATGFETVDSRAGGTARVIRVPAGSPAEAAGIKVGDILLSVDGEKVEDTPHLRQMIISSEPGSALAIECRSPSGEVRTVELAGQASPLLVPGSGRNSSRLLRAAWAEQMAAADPGRSAAPLANLALMMSESGRHQLAAETWRRVRWAGRQGVGDGTTAYYLGRVLMQLGRETAAIEKFRAAVGSEATAFDDYGPPLSEAAADHLADLGVGR